MKKLFICALISLTAFGQNAQVVPEFSLTRFTINDGGRGGLGAATGDVLPALKFRATLGVHYENNPLAYFRNGQRVGAVVSDRLQLHLGLGFGITSWLQVAAELPLLVMQRGDDLTATAGTLIPESFGLGSPRIAFRLGLLTQRAGGLIASDTGIDMALQVGASLPFGVGAALTVENGWNVTPQLSLGRNFGPVRFGAEVSALIRTAPIALTATSLRDTVGSQLGVRALLSSTGDGFRVEGSFHSMMSLAGQTPPGFELLAGARLPVGPIEFFVLGGPGFGSLPGTPQFRVFGGIGLRADVGECDEGQSHTPTQCPDLDDDQDGIKNRTDRCPLEPEDKDNFEDDDGCIDADNDADGVKDTIDLCPIEPGPKSNRGCPVKKAKDTDKDGIIDTEDECPTEPGPKENKGCPVKDKDGDGLDDDIDKCPTEAGPKSNGGCPIKDKDGDTVTDDTDNCVDVPGPVENQGCPKEQKQLVIITADKLVIKEKVFFATGKATILPVSFDLLRQVASVMRQHTEIQGIVIEGHTDSKGSADMNRKLSLNRARSVMQFLVHEGIDDPRLKAVGYGPDRPADTNKTEPGRANNRRVEFIISHESAPKIEEVKP
jgi:OmpA-OmpF porin, OOP family